MPILIALKNPRMNLIAEGEIGDDSIARWDEIFHNQVLMVKNQKGRNTLIPLLHDCNIAIMEEVTKEEVEEMEKKAKEKKKQMEEQGRDGGPGPLITKPGYAFPSGRGGRS